MKTLPLLQPLTGLCLHGAKTKKSGVLLHGLRRFAARLVGFSPSLLDVLVRVRRTSNLTQVGQNASGLWQAMDKPNPDAQQVGSVALVGAGPGCKDLITLRGAQRLQKADVIFYDRLIDPELLELAPVNAKRIYVGKAPGCHHWSQDKISATLVSIASQGQRVVRLKCGDPGVFARGAEEINALDTANIPYEIIPGVTAASAASAALGGFLTERGTCDTLVLATGQTAKDTGNANWIAQLQPGTRMAIYMGVGAAESTAKALIEAGLETQVSIDIVSRAQQSDQITAKCRASTLLDTIETSHISNPAIIFLTWPQSPT